MVYWADLLYEKAEEDLRLRGRAGEHGRGHRRRRRRRTARPRTAEEAAFLAGLRAKMTALSEAELAVGEPPPVPAHPQGALERVPLPWFIKRRFLDAYLRDVHHYLFDVEFGLPGKPPVRIQQTIRKRFVDAVAGPDVSRPYIVVSHSMGTVIAYDCLKRVGARGRRRPDHARSPLDLDEVQDKLQPGWTVPMGSPARRSATAG